MEKRIFFTSDTHFGQERTFKLSLRNMYFDNVRDMDNQMIKRWNETVKENDIVFHLGDFGNYEMAKELNGIIILLFGNYERSNNYSPTQAEKNYFYKVFDQKELKNVYDRDIIKSKSFRLVHEPENYSGSGFYLFGHIHEKQKVKRNGLNVGVDVHNFTPVSEEVIEFYRNAIINVYDNNCFDNF